MDRIKKIMEIMNTHLIKITGEGEESGFNEMLHIYGTAYISAAIAAARGLDQELAFIAGLLHDTGRIVDNIHNGGHGPMGAETAIKLLNEIGEFSKEEIEIISCAIRNHSNKKDIGTEYDEIVKDADVLERLFIMKDKYEDNKKKKKRLKNTLRQLELKLLI
ncbi:UNVERIFIED_CONTAM: HD domain-containing protein [Acetivibrio alkalicellulosi]